MYTKYIIEDHNRNVLCIYCYNY